MTSPFGFWYYANDAVYDTIQCASDCKTVVGIIKAITKASFDIDIFTDYDAIQKWDKDSGEYENEGGWLVQLPHFGISCHFTNLRRMQVYIFNRFKDVYPELTMKSPSSKLKEIAFSMNPGMPCISPILIGSAGSDDDQTLCISCPNLPRERWSTLPFGYAPGENPMVNLETKIAEDMTAINPLWRDELATMNPRKELLKATKDFQLYYFTDMGEKRFATKLMILREKNKNSSKKRKKPNDDDNELNNNAEPNEQPSDDEPNEQQNEEQPNEDEPQPNKLPSEEKVKQRLDLNLPKCEFLDDERFMMLKTGFGPKFFTLECQCCRYKEETEYASWQEFINMSRLHYLTHGDYGLAVFIEIAHTLRRRFFNRMYPDNLKKLISCKDYNGFEFGRMDDQGWHPDSDLQKRFKKTFD